MDYRLVFNVMSPAEIARQYVPLSLLSLLAPDARTATLNGAVLAADLTDFTGLTEALSQRAGTEGGDLLGRELHQALAPAVDRVMAHGGDVVKFAGDGLLCVFPGDDMAGAQQAADAMAGLQVRGPDGALHRFRLALTHGPVDLLRLGGHGGRWELVASGPAVLRAQAMLAGAAPGATPPVQVLPATRPPPTPQSVAGAEAYLPAYVRERLSDDLADWLKQVRTLTLVFVAFEAGGDPALLQARAVACQALVDGHAGQLMRFGLEEGVLVAEIAFGLALGPHATGPAEALQCAAALARTVAGCRVGISTGRVLLGPIGSATRRQLTSLGSAVNLAARLMQQAPAGEVLVDEPTWAAAAEGRHAGEPRRVVLKGLGERRFHRLLAGQAAPAAAAQAFFGRAAECATVLATLAEGAAPARPIVLQGEAGIGKSRFVRWLADELRLRAVQVWTAPCTPVGRDIPYASLVPVIAGLCGLAPSDADAAALEPLAAQLLGNAARAALLRDALGLARGAAPAGADVSGHVRADQIREALLALFAARAGARCAALVVEDAHWLDSTSWLLLQRLASETSAWRIVIATRPQEREEPPALAALRARGALVVQLQPLDEPAIVAVACERLHVRELPPALARWIAGRVRGNPFFAQELASMLVAAAGVVVDSGRVLRAPGLAELEALKLAPTIEGTIEQRIDRLGVDDAVVLKLASVIGPHFELDEVAELGRHSDASAVVARLVAADMAVDEGAGRYAFRHRLTQEVAYAMLPREQQRELHARVAAWLQARLADRAEERAGDLAHHWYRAERWPQAAEWLERAGRRALATGADSEAATHFRRALTLEGGQPAGRRAAWHRQLAQALFGLGQVEGVATEARHAFELVAHTLPTGVLGWTGLALATAARRSAGTLLLGARPTIIGDPRRWDQLEGARAAALLAESAYFVNAPEMMLASALLAVDMSERTGLSAPVSTAYGMLAVVLGMARLHTTARRYLARALAIAEEAGDVYQQGVAWFYAGIYHGCLGEWAASLAASRRGLALTDALGAYMLSGRQLTVIATNALYTSDYAATRAWMDIVRTRAERLANVQQIGWSGNVVSVADLHQGRYAQAIEHTERSREIFLLERDHISLTISEGVRCAALARCRHMAAALEGADRAAQLVSGARPTTWGQLEGFAGPCEVYATALAQRLVTPQALRPRLAPALRALRLFALVFPFGRARYQWLQGQLALAAGRPASARRYLLRAVATARRFGMPYEEWRATELLASLPGGELQAPRLHVLQARVLAGEAQAALQGTQAD